MFFDILSHIFNFIIYPVTFSGKISIGTKMVLYHFSFGLESFFNFPSYFCGQVFFIVFFTADSLNKRILYGEGT